VEHAYLASEGRELAFSLKHNTSCVGKRSRGKKAIGKEHMQWLTHAPAEPLGGEAGLLPPPYSGHISEAGLPSTYFAPYLKHQRIHNLITSSVFGPSLSLRQAPPLTHES
jgi:hypothetical protein